MSEHTITTQKALRDYFWESHPEFKKQYRKVSVTCGEYPYQYTRFLFKEYRQNDYNATIRAHWCSFVDSCQRDGIISDALAHSATL